MLALHKLTLGPGGLLVALPRGVPGGGLVGGSEARIFVGSILGWRLGMLGSGVRSQISVMGGGSGQIVVRSRDVQAHHSPFRASCL